MQVKQIMTRAVATCQPFEKLIDAASVLHREDVGCLPVVTGDGSERVLGMLTDRDIAMATAREGRPLAEMHVRNAMTSAVLSRDANASLGDALGLILATGVRRLPVVDRDGRLLGLLSLSDLTLSIAAAKGSRVAACGAAAICRILAATSRQRNDPESSENRTPAVDELMAQDVVTCRVNETLGDVARRMDRTGVPCTPVLEEGGGHRVAAVLTDRDICIAAVRRGRPLDDLGVEVAMSGALRSCWPDDSPEAAAAIMRAYGVRRLPVVDASFDLRGIVTLGDIARASLGGDAPRIDSPPCDEIVDTLAAIIQVAGERSSRYRSVSGDSPRRVEI